MNNQSLIQSSNNRWPMSINVAVLLIATLTLMGCVTTNTARLAEETELLAETTETSHAVDECRAHAQGIADNASISLSSAQYLAAAKAMQQCINMHVIANANVNQNKSVNQQLMQMYADSTLNYIKAGELSLAQKSVKDFENSFPNQDLYFADYTSFLDTTTAIINGQFISHDALVALNINPILRAEIERNRYWRNH